ncbi:MAG: MoaD/ThiS family protein [Novosphingobium sp.]|nr:MoaD/ThiS family protein [Novosphingobium sp.]
MVRLVFLGKLADLAGAGAMDINGTETLKWESLLAMLAPDLAQTLQGDKVRVALNGEVLPDKTALVAAPGSEVAFFPPVSGG